MSVAYELTGLDSAAGIRRILEIAIADALGMENGIGRLRVLIAGAATAMRLLEVADIEGRLAALESVVKVELESADPKGGGPIAPTSLLRDPDR